jgi:small-conductance mechanosensitive channel
VLKRLWHLFQEHGVEIPFPQSDIRIKEWPARPERQG